MKVLLVEVLPEKETLTINLLPSMGLGYIASSLQANGYNVSILDSVSYNHSIGAALKLIVKENPDVIGYTATSSARFRAADLIKKAKEATGAFTVAGGRHFGAMPKTTIEKIKEIDVVVIGEGENIMVDLLNSYSSRNNLSGVQGICFRDCEGSIIQSPPKEPPELDLLPLPAYHLFNLEKYNYSFEGSKTRAIGIMSSRGCPNRCIFCATLGKKTLRLRNPDKFVDEIEFLKNNYGYEAFDFWDDTLTINREHVTRICREIIKRGLNIRWLTRGRVDTVDEEMLSLMKKAGCVSIAYGVESGSDNVLRIMKKGINTRQAKEAVELSSKLGFIVDNFFIIGMPGESFADIDMTLDMINKFRRLPHVKNTYCFPMVYPGTELEKIAREGSLGGFDWFAPYYSITNKLAGNDPNIPCFEQEGLSIKDIKLHILTKQSWPDKVKASFIRLRKIRTLGEVFGLFRYLIKSLLKDR